MRGVVLNFYKYGTLFSSLICALIYNKGNYLRLRSFRLIKSADIFVRTREGYRFNAAAVLSLLHDFSSSTHNTFLHTYTRAQRFVLAAQAAIVEVFF